MKQTIRFQAFSLLAALILGGCYTRLASNGAGYYTYTPRPVYSDTLRNNQALETPLVTYDTTMHGDTMFIDEHQATAAEQAENVTPSDNGNTIINNYYGSDSYWNSNWWPSWGISVGFSWPYYYNSWYSPWWPYYYTPYYYSGWYSGYGYFGAYPPFYNAYSPYYAYGYYRPHHYWGFGYGRYNSGGYGLGYASNLNIQPGRIGGESRMPTTIAPRSTPVNGITSTLPGQMAGAQSTATNRSNLAESNALQVIRTAEDRNAPVHVLSPDAVTGIRSRPQTNVVVRTESLNSSAVNTSTGRVVGMNTSPNSHPIIVRRMDNGQTITTTSNSGHQMVVVRRSDGNSYENSRSYAPSYRSNSSSSGGYTPATRGEGNRGNYQAPARSYSPPARSYSPPARSYSPPARSYSPPARSYSPPERDSAPSGGGQANDGGGRSYGGGGESSGRGGGRAR